LWRIRETLTARRISSEKRRGFGSSRIARAFSLFVYFQVLDSGGFAMETEACLFQPNPRKSSSIVTSNRPLLLP